MSISNEALTAEEAEQVLPNPKNGDQLGAR